jgi:arginine decarboxylase-like protein
MYDNDYVGFKFDGVHFTIFPHQSENQNSVIKLTRVSEGDRYSNNLLPQAQDATVDVPGGDGTYYFGTNFKYKQFDINFAFDELSEQNIRRLRQIFSKRNSLAPLIFDEEPYKYWMVKC